MCRGACVAQSEHTLHRALAMLTFFSYLSQITQRPFFAKMVRAPRAQNGEFVALGITDVALRNIESALQ
eukprot:7378573-Prymnesium_polylepis.2